MPEGKTDPLPSTEKKPDPKSVAERQRPSTGGQYIRDRKTGEISRQGEATREHPDGNRPRDRRGKPL